MWKVKRVRWLGIKPNITRKLTPAKKKPDLKVTQKDIPYMMLLVYHILIKSCAFIPWAQQNLYEGSFIVNSPEYTGSVRNLYCEEDSLRVY